jgi:prepilin-type processing-associated H-X9-DG protein/prepilin-type N-terminal cleavage/methylation domain-containing protein
MRRCAFTLVELLVVVALIGMLVALLLAAVHKAKQRGQTAACASNLRQLALANLTFAAEHDGQYVQAQERDNNVRWHGMRSSNGSPFDGRRGPLAPYLGTDARVKLCPVFDDVLTGPDSFEVSTGGYGYNAAYIGGQPGRPFVAERLANVPHPMRTVMFTDAAFAREKGIQEYAYCEPYQWVDAAGKMRGTLMPSVHFRHDGRANVAWCDGHVTAEVPVELGKLNGYGGDSEKWKIGWFGPRRENGYWNPKAQLEEPLAIVEGGAR